MPYIEQNNQEEFSINKNEKFHGAEFDVSAHAISDDELDAVSGSCGECDIVVVRCPYCNAETRQNTWPRTRNSVSNERTAPPTGIPDSEPRRILP